MAHCVSTMVSAWGPRFCASTLGEVLPRTLRQVGVRDGGDGARRQPGSSRCVLGTSFYSDVDTRAEARELTARPGKRVLSTARSSDVWKRLRRAPTRPSCRMNLPAKRAIPGSSGSRCWASTRRYDFAPGTRYLQSAADAVRKSAIDRGNGQLAPVAGSPLLERYLEGVVEGGIKTQDTLKALAETFWVEVERSGMQLDRDRTLAFLAAALSKPFIILTGQSGSGKTQLAQRLGEWCGVDSVGRPRYVVIPVRPDWTGPEYLFGYPDGLRPKVQGRAVWSVPNTLEFIFRAHADPSAPYVLVLDEMNLAHVERYFADFLSGIESREPVVPALELFDGQWVEPEHGEQWPIPTNLIVVGTVNVDETTYMFSPKVLDRAFTFEFRVGAEDLDGALRRPAPAGAATSDVLARVVETRSRRRVAVRSAAPRASRAP